MRRLCDIFETGVNSFGFFIIEKDFVYLYMLLQLENTNKANIDKLLAFAEQNHLKLSLIDDVDNNLHLPGKPLTPEELTQLIEKSRASGIISIEQAHKIIRDKYNAD
ncbi:hypothetical protein GCM10027043_50050 [Ferruginibacter profundus]